ncbi:3-ketosteroid 9alpha-monooxygenase subunit B [Tamaricihabitans halophyticus]|uniref:3-ketosteroid 9alpha-monooxygenase subunit B n=1 Tax=Tamaricihabitans halophyticus TaxID=1262583 RepID=A0A4R2Q3D4_9PSEU|nr:ferredoxin--NADP reductase [Tamaricihabitans halophyticus]TCP41141.1 3-ketosteroid 9alpha-monooxygenase subunit B [Tamaricihabitans halophyticus]
MNTAFPVRVSKVIAETAETCSFELATAAEHDRLDYRPGQFLTVRVPSEHTGSVARCYSLSSSPHVDPAPRITVKRTPGGYASHWLCDNLRVGTELTVLPPAGVFTPASLDEDVLLLAAGSGITPVLSIVKSILAAGSGRVVLVYANPDERAVIFAAELRDLSAAYPDRLVVTHWLVALQGMPNAGRLAALLAPYAELPAYLCGPAGFYDAAREALHSLGVPRNRVHIEKFHSLSNSPFEAAPAPAPDVDRPATELAVELDGQRHALSWPAGTKLLDLMLEAGIDAPFSCREGACSACACRLVSGEVKMLNNEVLDDEDIAEGIVLACQSLPVTDSVQISYE